jgi:hypothetical protein
MLTIKNYTKLEGMLLEFTGGWKVEFCEEWESVYVIHIKNPAQFQNNRQVVHLSRTLESLGNGELRYFFYYAGEKIEWCIDAEYISNMYRMLATLCKIVNTKFNSF